MAGLYSTFRFIVVNVKQPHKKTKKTTEGQVQQVERQVYLTPGRWFLQTLKSPKGGNTLPTPTHQLNYLRLTTKQILTSLFHRNVAS